MLLRNHPLTNLTVAILLLAAVPEANGILKFLLQTLGLDDSPPSRPGQFFDGWRPLLGLPQRPRRPDFRNRPPQGQQFQGRPVIGHPATTRLFPDMKFRQKFIDTTPSPLFRVVDPPTSPPSDNSNRIRPFQIHAENNSLHLSEMLTAEEISKPEIKIFDTIRPEILENTLFRFERKH